MCAFQYHRPQMRRTTSSIPLAASVALLFACRSTGTGQPVYSGTIEAVEVDVVAEVSGRLLSRPVDQGDRVRKGDAIATIDPKSYQVALAEAQATIREAKARLDQLVSGYRREEIEGSSHEAEEASAQAEQAEARVRRIEELRLQKIATPDDLDVALRDRNVARARLAAARSRLALLTKGYRREEVEQALAEVSRLEAVLDSRQLDLDRTAITSPVDGTVTQKLLEPGEYARPGSPIVTVVDLDHLYTWVYLAETELPSVSLGQEVSVRVDGMPSRDFPGKVVYISQTAEFTPKNVQTVQDRVQLVYGVKVSVDNTDGALKVGIPADVILRPARAAQR